MGRSIRGADQAVAGPNVSDHSDKRARKQHQHEQIGHSSLLRRCKCLSAHLARRRRSTQTSVSSKLSNGTSKGQWSCRRCNSAGRRRSRAAPSPAAARIRRAHGAMRTATKSLSLSFDTALVDTKRPRNHRRRAPTDASSTAPIAWHLGFHPSRECVPCGRAPQFLIPGREGELAAYHVRDFLASDLEDLANVAAPRRVAMFKAYGTGGEFFSRVLVVTPCIGKDRQCKCQRDC